VELGRFLFAMWEGGGTAPPELAVVSRLIARGHEVSVLGDPSLSTDVEAAGARFEPWRNAPHRTTRTPETEIIRDWAAVTPLGAFARARDRHAFRPAHLFAREVRDAFTAHPADVVVACALLFGALAGAEATGAAVAALLPMTSFLGGRGRPPSGMGLTPACGAVGRLRDRALYALGDAVLWRSCLPGLNRARACVGLGKVGHPLDQIRRADRVLVQTSPWFDFDAPAVQGNIRYVGPELDDPAWASSSWALPWPADCTDPIVLVAFSTTFMGQVPLLERIIDALGPLHVRALVTVGPSLDPRAFVAPAHVVVCASAPHSKVLPRAALVVTHGGHGTVIRALAHGVPLLCLPMGRDQSDNAARAVAIGGASTLSHRASVRAIRRAIAHNVGDARLHRGAQHAKEKLESERIGDPVIEELEALVATHA
jgi:UDP:flavonoid glycosyltransferase YjiC (YdhE family)